MFTNNCIPNYFFGDTMSQDEQSDKNILNYPEDVHSSEPNLNLSSIPSPSSSLASTKKLEWDSGADIGYIYDSVKLKHSRKSKSYPSLNMDPHPKASASQDGETKPKIHLSTGATNINKLDCIGEGDSLKPTKNKKSKTFKHSTPLYNRQIVKSCAGDDLNLNQNEKATSPINIVHEIRDECLQTTLIHKSSKEVQTEFENVAVDKSLQTNLTEVLGSQSMSSSSSKSGSFKYIPGSEFIVNSHSSNGTIKSGESGVAITKSNSNSSSSRRDESDSGSCSPLGQMISTQYSKSLIADIDQSLDILQKFIKSKNYSNDTKRHYAKKIVTKIINTRYSDDTESSSDVKTSPLLSLIEDKSNSSNNISKSEDRKYVECGIQCDEINKKSQIISDRNDCKIKESLEKLNALQTDLKNWRDSQTLSEKLFEARKTRKSKYSSSSSSNRNVEDVDGKRDCLIQHSKNERRRQLSWINNEISYLQKLKDLLQTKEQSTTTNTSTSSSIRKTDLTLNSVHKKDERISNLEDVERKFNKEFGLLPSLPSSSDCKSKSQETLKKLSKYLTNEQIKFILDHDVHKKPDNIERKINLNSSYNSHKNSIYGAETRPIAPLDLHPNSKTLSLVNAATQYSISKTSDRNLNDDQQVKLPFYISSQPDPNSNPNPISISIPEPIPDQSYSTSEYDESIIVEVDKENLIKKQIAKAKTKTKCNKGGTAYFLTFEEESLSEFDNDSERRILEQVVVKIPKYRRSTRKPNTNTNTNTNTKSVLDKHEPCTSTLEEYLMKNRPNFVKSANWRWSHVRSLDSQDKHNLFTCQEMQEMSKKKYNNLPEIQERVKNSKTQTERRHNRFMANIFSKKLQKKTLQGHICLATCKDVMASE